MTHFDNLLKAAGQVMASPLGVATPKENSATKDKKKRKGHNKRGDTSGTPRSSQRSMCDTSDSEDEIRGQNETEMYQAGMDKFLMSKRSLKFIERKTKASLKREGSQRSEPQSVFSHLSKR